MNQHCNSVHPMSAAELHLQKNPLDASGADPEDPKSIPQRRVAVARWTLGITSITGRGSAGFTRIHQVSSNMTGWKIPELNGGLYS